jgi:hypothetical protein
VLAVPLAACGKGAGQAAAVTHTVTSAAPETGATTSPAPPAGSPSLTPAQADAFALAVNLTASDVPGFSVKRREAHRSSASERALEARLRRCVGGSAAATGGPTRPEQDSPQFARRVSVVQQTVSSSVSFAASASAAAGELRLLRSPHTRGCLSSYVGELLRGGRLGSGTVKRVSIAQGVPPAPGTSGGFAWRITAVLQARGVQIPFYLDVLGFVEGPAQVMLQSSGLIVPFPASAEEALFRLLLARARAHPPGG